MPRGAARYWLAALVISGAILAASGYRPRDPDSRAYIDIAARLSSEPVRTWIAPQWWGAWEREGAFREHPNGVFLVPALVARAGYPAQQAVLLVNSLSQVVCLIFAASLAARFVSPRIAPFTAVLLQFLPIAFVFRIRGNQEYPLLAALCVALYAVDRASDGVRWIVLAIAAFVFGALVKGVFALLFPVICALWLVGRRGEGGPGRAGWAAIAGMIVAAPLLTIAYEWAYATVTGDSFLSYYFGPRVSLENQSSGAVGLIVTKAYNLAWYSSRVIWYAAPWCLVLVLLPWLRTTATGPRERRGILFAVTAAILVVAALALRDTKADRYVFPAYFLIGTAGSLATVHLRPGWLAWAERLAAKPALAPAVWLGLFLLRWLSGASLPQLTFWRS